MLSRSLNDQLEDRRVVVVLTEKARTRLAKLGHDTAMGARPMGRVIQTEIKDRIADELLFGVLTKGGVVTVDVAKRKKGKKKAADSDSPAFAFSFDPVGKKQ